MPLILPGVISGALFAFITSFDEIVIVLFVAGGRAAHHPARDVVGYPRADQPDDSRRGDNSRGAVDRRCLTTIELLRRRLGNGSGG